MHLSRFEMVGPNIWRLDPVLPMRAPVLAFAGKDLFHLMDRKALAQAANTACLPGVAGACLVLPDAHSGYGFPIGGVAAFDPAQGGVVSAGGVGFDIACGVRTLATGLAAEDVLAHAPTLADELFKAVPCGLGRAGDIHLSPKDIDAMLAGGAAWAVGRGYGTPRDLGRIEDNGRMPGAEPGNVSPRAKERMAGQLGTLGSGNHYLEVQRVAEIMDPDKAEAFGLVLDTAVVSIHCGSRGLGHQIGTDFLPRMAKEAKKQGIRPPDKELACVAARSKLGREYLGAMRAGINCALANRQAITHLVRGAFARVFPEADLTLVYDVCHNTCKEEEHDLDGYKRPVMVHRKGATRALPPGHPALPRDLAAFGQPVLVGGSMGTSSYVLAGTSRSPALALASACHGAGRALSRTQAKRRFKGRDVVDSLGHAGVHVRTVSFKGVAEEAPQAYKDIHMVVDSAVKAGLADPVARLEPMACVKG